MFLQIFFREGFVCLPNCEQYLQAQEFCKIFPNFKKKLGEERAKNYDKLPIGKYN